ncbi:unnamed protein product, partial [Brassica rapa subsp. trilocularis]
SSHLTSLSLSLERYNLSAGFKQRLGLSDSQVSFFRFT